MFTFNTRFSLSAFSSGLAIAFLATCSMQAYGGNNDESGIESTAKVASKVPASSLKGTYLEQLNIQSMKTVLSHVWNGAKAEDELFYQFKTVRDDPFKTVRELDELYDPLKTVRKLLNSFYEPGKENIPAQKALIGFLEERFQKFSFVLPLNPVTILEMADSAHKKAVFSQMTSALAILERCRDLYLDYIVKHIAEKRYDPARSLELITAAPYIKIIFEDVLNEDPRDDELADPLHYLQMIIPFAMEIPEYEMAKRLELVAGRIKKLFVLSMNYENKEDRLNLVRTALMIPTNEIRTRLSLVREWRHLLNSERMRGTNMVSVTCSAMKLPSEEIEERIRCVYKNILPLFTRDTTGLEQARIIEEALSLPTDELK